MAFYPQATPDGPTPALGFFRETVGPDLSTSWSDLTSSLLEEAERCYGPRDPRWFFAGILFADVAAPCTYYPGNRPFHVGIQLTRSVAQTPKIAHYQLAHEVAHLLGPSEAYRPANVLEEGMAARFQESVNQARGLGIIGMMASYKAASDLLDELLAVAPDAVRTIRATHPCIDQLTAEALQSLVPGVEDDLATALCAPFVRGD